MCATLPTPYPALNALLRDLVGRQQQILGDKLTGVYLTGSLAVGDFDEHSDVDFLAVIEDDLTPSELLALQEMHLSVHALGSKYPPDIPSSARKLAKDHWETSLEGSYFPRVQLRRNDLPRAKQWFLDNGANSLELSDHDDTLVSRWMVRERGIALTGSHPIVLVDPIPPERLRQEVYQTMRRVAGEMTDPYWHSAFGQPYAVMTYCRMLQTLETATIRSKRSGVRWGLQNLDSRWAGLIRRAWECRGYVWVGDPPDEDEFALTLEFIGYAISVSDKMAGCDHSLNFIDLPATAP